MTTWGSDLHELARVSAFCLGEMVVLVVFAAVVSGVLGLIQTWGRRTKRTMAPTHGKGR
jgi:hypothetical protein